MTHQLYHLQLSDNNLHQHNHKYNTCITDSRYEWQLTTHACNLWCKCYMNVLHRSIKSEVLSCINHLTIVVWQVAGNTHGSIMPYRVDNTDVFWFSLLYCVGGPEYRVQHYIANTWDYVKRVVCDTKMNQFPSSIIPSMCRIEYDSQKSCPYGTHQRSEYLFFITNPV